MKIFISVGMTGRREEEVRADIIRAQEYVKEHFPFRCIDGVEFVDNYDCQAPEDASPLWCLGEAIKKLGECDACCFVDGWINYHGCCVEYEVCKTYGIYVIKM